MKKFKGWLIFIFILIFLVVVFWVIKTPIVASYLSSKLKTEVTISNVVFSKNQILINDFKIKNPKKAKSKYAFEVKDIEIDFSFSKLRKKPSIIDNVVLKDIVLNIECSNPLCIKNNWTELVNNMNEIDKKQKKEKEVIVKNLSLQDMQVNITGMGLDFGKTTKTHISSLNFNNVSSKKGFPTQKLIAAIFRSSNMQKYLKGVVEDIEFIDQVFKGFKRSSRVRKSS